MLETQFPFFISKKPGEIPIFGTLLAKKSILAYISLKIDIFRSAMFWYDVIRWPIFIILVSMERRHPTLYYGTNNYNFKITGGGNHSSKEDVLQKRLRKTRVNGQI